MLKLLKISYGVCVMVVALAAAVTSIGLSVYELCK